MDEWKEDSTMGRWKVHTFPVQLRYSAVSSRILQMTASSKSCIWSLWAATTATSRQLRSAACSARAASTTPSSPYQKTWCHSWSTWTAPSCLCLTRPTPSVWPWRSPQAVRTQTSGITGEFHLYSTCSTRGSQTSGCPREYPLNLCCYYIKLLELISTDHSIVSNNKSSFLNYRTIRYYWNALLWNDY